MTTPSSGSPSDSSSGGDRYPDPASSQGQGAQSYGDQAYGGQSQSYGGAPSYGSGQSYGGGQGYGDTQAFGDQSHGGQGYGAQGYAGQGFGDSQAYGVQSYGSGAASPAHSGAPACPPSNVGWAVAAILFFWPLSFLAMTRAVDVHPLWSQGRYAEAQAASDSAKKLGQISIGIIVALLVLYILFIILMVGVTATGF